MKYLLLIYGNQEKWASIPAEEWPEAIARQDAFNRRYRATGELIGAYGLTGRAGTGKVVCVVSGGNINLGKLCEILGGAAG
jgi:hypothetical protein